jgi:hypothetical protein
MLACGPSSVPLGMPEKIRIFCINAKAWCEQLVLKEKEIYILEN